VGADGLTGGGVEISKVLDFVRALVAFSPSSQQHATATAACGGVCKLLKHLLHSALQTRYNKNSRFLIVLLNMRFNLFYAQKMRVRYMMCTSF